MTPEMIAALAIGLTNMLVAGGGIFLAYQKLKIEFKDKTQEQTATLKENAAGIAETVATKLEHTESIHRLEINKSNNFNIKIAKLEGQQEIMTRYLNALLQVTGVELKKEES